MITNSVRLFVQNMCSKDDVNYKYVVVVYFTKSRCKPSIRRHSKNTNLTSLESKT